METDKSRPFVLYVAEIIYQKIYEIKTLDAVIMFMPYESAFDSMLEKTEESILEADKYKIILASPSTLISVLKIIDNMWSINERNKNILNVYLLFLSYWYMSKIRNVNMISFSFSKKCN